MISEVVAGVYQIQLPLPFPLKIVHAYALRDQDGWTLIDTGLNYAPGRDVWQAAFRTLDLDPRRVRRIILTHAHPDHYGMAGWLAAMSGAPVYLAPAERAFVYRTWLAGAAEQHAVEQFFRRHGVPSDLLTVVDGDIAALRAMTQPPPARFVDLLPGSELRIGERRFAVIEAPGHSDGQLVFYCAGQGLLLCGDAVLLKITPNVGRWPGGDSNPLATFLATLGRLKELDVELALAGHGPPITAFRSRIAELEAHHAERLAQAMQVVGRGNDAYAVCRGLFATETLTSHQLRFAMAETLAHLEYLVACGRLTRDRGTPIGYAPAGRSGPAAVVDPLDSDIL